MVAADARTFSRSWTLIEIIVQYGFRPFVSLIIRWRASANGDEEGKPNGHGTYSQGVEIWKEAPILKGSTEFEPRPEVKNIMVTGGAGFM